MTFQDSVLPAAVDLSKNIPALLEGKVLQAGHDSLIGGHFLPPFSHGIRIVGEEKGDCRPSATGDCELSMFVSFFCPKALRGAWRDRDTNDIFAHCSLIFYFLDFKFSNFFCLSELHPLIWFFLKNFFRKKKNIRKTTQNALAPSIFIVLSIALKLGTPLLHTQAQNTLLQNF